MGRSLIDGSKEVKLFGETIEVEAHIESLQGISGHADRDGLLAWVNAYEKKPEQIFAVHGDDAVCDLFVRTLNEDYGLKADAPFSGSSYDLAEGCWLTVTKGIPVSRESAASKKAAGVFARLLAAGDRLRQVIFRNEGGANKDLAKFADQINSLCDKWDR